MNWLEEEKKYFLPVFSRIPVEIARGDGVYLYDRQGLILGFCQEKSRWYDRSIPAGHLVEEQYKIELSSSEEPHYFRVELSN